MKVPLSWVVLTLTGYFATALSQETTGSGFYKDCQRHDYATCAGMEINALRKLSKCWESSKGCSVAVKIIPHDAFSIDVYLQFKRTPSVQYGAVAISLSPKMRPGMFVMECLEQVELSGQITIKGFLSSTGEEDAPQRLNPVLEDTVIELPIPIADGYMQCHFRIPTNLEFSSIAYTGHFYLKDEKYYLLLAYGPTTENRLAPHFGKAGYETPFIWTTIQTIQARGLPPLVRAHGILMTLAYVTFMPVATIIARFFRETWTQFYFWKKRIWFWIHAGLLYGTLACAVSAYLCMGARGEWFPGEGGGLWHAIIGMTSIILLVTQTILPWVLMSPSQPKIRKIYAIVHAAVGMLCYTLGIFNIALTDILISGYLPCRTTFVTFMWIGLHASMFVFFSTLLFIKDHEIPGIDTTLRAFFKFPMKMKTSDEAPGSLARQIFLGIFVFISLSMAGIHIYFITK